MSKIAGKKPAQNNVQLNFTKMKTKKTSSKNCAKISCITNGMGYSHHPNFQPKDYLPDNIQVKSNSRQTLFTIDGGFHSYSRKQRA
jgi:hypothetical protein